MLRALSYVVEVMNFDIIRSPICSPNFNGIVMKLNEIFDYNADIKNVTVSSKQYEDLHRISVDDPTYYSTREDLLTSFACIYKKLGTLISDSASSVSTKEPILNICYNYMKAVYVVGANV